MDIQAYVLLGVVIGIVARTVGPWLLRVLAGDKDFDWNFLRSAVVGAFLSAATAGLAVPIAGDGLTPFAALWLGATTGYAFQTAVRHVEKRSS